MIFSVLRESPAGAGLAALHSAVGTVPGYLGLKLLKIGRVPSGSPSGFCCSSPFAVDCASHSCHFPQPLLSLASHIAPLGK